MSSIHAFPFCLVISLELINLPLLANSNEKSREVLLDRHIINNRWHLGIYLWLHGLSTVVQFHVCRSNTATPWSHHSWTGATLKPVKCSAVRRQHSQRYGLEEDGFAIPAALPLQAVPIVWTNTTPHYRPKVTSKPAPHQGVLQCTQIWKQIKPNSCSICQMSRMGGKKRSTLRYWLPGVLEWGIPAPFNLHLLHITRYNRPGWKSILGTMWLLVIWSG